MSGATYYAFRDSAADSTKGDINTVMGGIANTLEDIDNSIEDLRGGWEATEADAYYEIITKWKEGATNLKDVLADVQEALQNMKDGNTQLREGIAKVLDETS